jgi:hypothetical protein
LSLALACFDSTIETAKEDGGRKMRGQYERDYYDFLQELRDREDECARNEEKASREKLCILSRGLGLSLQFARAVERSGVKATHDEILAVLKECVPEVWRAPEARPLINLLFPGSR